ncbi:hypothetical protein HMPREF0774_1545 [Staphylococcus aureus subsp. aureus TCH130]|nr:hypothetical protein HMPREF0774_1545 [Staphylococcus aureus subsp. aureus TCH130]
MYDLVYCFKLDEFEFNLKSKYKKYKPVISRCSRVLYTIYMCVLNNKKPIIHKVNNNLNFLLTRFFSLLLKTEQYRIAFIELKNK